MSTATPDLSAHSHGPGAGHGRHDAHLAHHFDTPEQQFTSAKLGMWVFLGTEILMFGGLFCAYSIYRGNHPLVFKFGAEAYLHWQLGALNTIILITSSLTMAWGVRAAQLDNRRLLITCLVLTLMGAAGFLVVKAVEYSQKWNEHVWVGSWNKYNADNNALYRVALPQEPAAAPAVPARPRALEAARLNDGNYISNGASNSDLSQIKPVYDFAINSDTQVRVPLPPSAGSGVASEGDREARYRQLSEGDQWRVNAFFSCYFLMTGLHGIHVLVGMALISWILIRALRRDFSSEYFTPVDLVGLYWHLVDLIWIFLFPLLYLIH